MGLARLSIEQQRAKMSIEIQNAQISIENSTPQIKVHSKSPEMTVQWERPSFTVDFQRARGVLAYQMPELHSLLTNQLTIMSGSPIQDVQYVDGTHDVAKLDGDQKRRPGGGAPIKTIPIRKMASRPAMHNKVMPRYRKHRPDGPNIDFNPGDFSIEWSQNEFYIEWEGPFLPQISVEPYSIDIIIEEQPYIKIFLLDDAEELKVAGRYVNEQV